MRILGMGQTAQALHKKFPVSQMYDDKHSEQFDSNSDELTVVSPGIPPYNNLVKQSKNICSDYDVFAEVMPFSIWISGTNGKTTTTQMIQHLLEEVGSVCGGNIGVPISDLDEKAAYWVLETSSFTLHYTNKAKPNIYVLLPISDDHVSWHGTFKEYENSKLKPLGMMNENDIAIIPEIYKETKTKAQLYTYKDSEDLAKLLEIDTSKIKFKDPFLLDALLSLFCEKIVCNNLSFDKINEFKVDEHKVEEFLDSKGNLWVNDSKATNVDATIWALKGYKDKKISLILGGDDKGADLNPLFKQLQQYDVKVYTIGSNKDRLEQLCIQYIIDYEKYTRLSEVVNKLRSTQQILDQNSVVLLSPAAASLDQYSSYKERGKEFKKLVLN